MIKRKSVVKARHHATLQSPSPDDVLLSGTVGSRGEVMAIWGPPSAADALYARTGRPGGPSFPVARTERPVPVTVTKHHPDIKLTVRIPGLSLAYPRVQPLPDDRILVYGARCQWRESGAEHNAEIVNSNGERLRQGVLGDGIEDLVTTPQGRIWVSYFDEGVFGNRGWGGPGPEPIGSPGIVRFNEHFEREWTYPDDTDFDSIDDCYAFNVGEETVFAYYYSDFPIVRIDDSGVQEWDTGEFSDGRELAADGERCALYVPRDEFVAGKLEDSRFVMQRKGRIAIPRKFREDADYFGRGDALHILARNEHYKVDLDQMLAT